VRFDHVGQLHRKRISWTPSKPFGTSDAFTLNELKMEEFERATMARIGRCQIKTR
jgi:hypothetical protein